MKTFILIAAILSTSSAFAVSYCKIKGSDQMAGFFPGDNTRGPSIYVQGRGYYTITSYRDEGEILISSKNGRTVILDFRNKALSIDGKVQPLVKCVRNGSE
jgi:hypothetical protein